MLNDEICELRDRLNRSIEDGEDYDIIYEISVQLDELIAKHYKEKSEPKLKSKSKLQLSKK